MPHQFIGVRNWPNSSALYQSKFINDFLCANPAETTMVNMGKTIFFITKSNTKIMIVKKRGGSFFFVTSKKPFLSLYNHGYRYLPFAAHSF
jgi:hypothetical protein